MNTVYYLQILRGIDASGGHTHEGQRAGEENREKETTDQCLYWDLGHYSNRFPMGSFTWQV